MQGRERSEGMSKSKTGLQSLGLGSQKRVWDREGQAGSSAWSSENRTKVCGWMGYTGGDLRTSLGPGEVWIGLPVRCYMVCNSELWPLQESGACHFLKLVLEDPHTHQNYCQQDYCHDSLWTGVLQGGLPLYGFTWKWLKVLMRNSMLQHHLTFIWLSISHHQIALWGRHSNLLYSTIPSWVVPVLRTWEIWFEDFQSVNIQLCLNVCTAICVFKH